MRIRNFVLLSFFGLSLAVCIAACDKNKDDNDDNTNNIDSTSIAIVIKDINGSINKVVDAKNGKVMSQIEQKEYLEKVALEFMGITQADDFKDLVDLGEYISETYIDNYDWNNVEDWANDAFESTREALGTKTKDTETTNWIGWDGKYYTYIDNYIYTNYKSLLLASNFTGHFTANNGRWLQDKADDLQFIFTDKQGQQCVVKLTTSGSVKKVYMLNVDDWQRYDYESNGNTSTYNEYYDRTQLTIGVPEKVEVLLTQGGKQVVKSTLSIDLGSIDGEEFDISRSNLSISATVELNNGYKIETARMAYSGNTSTAASFILSKNNTHLVSMGVSADVVNLPSVNISAFSSDSFDEEDYNFDDANAKKAFVKLDILGKVQIQGTLSDVRKFADYLDAAAENDNNEKNYKSYINQANALMDVNLFYDGKGVKQAATKLEPFAEESWNGRTYWESEPVIFFYDGTSYSTFEAFFNERDFKKTIDTFEKLIDNYAELAD